MTGLTAMLVAVLAPLVAGLASLLAPRGRPSMRTVIALLGPVVAFGALLAHAVGAGVDAGPVGFAYLEALRLDVTFNPDRLGLFFALLVTGVGSLIVLYARGYFGPDDASLRRFHPTLGFFATAMTGLVLADNFLLMFVFWELTSISSFLLIGWDRENPKAVRLAMQAFITTGLGGMALLGGLITLGVATGAWSFTALADVGLDGAGRTLVVVGFLLAFAGGAAKSAQWPLHFWLPGAMAAPTPVSAYLHSATMVKAGVYLFARLFPIVGDVLGNHWAPTLCAFGAATMLLGAYLALRSIELKKVFAYTTVSQLGLLTCAYGLGGLEYGGQANAVWPVTQILNHALYKAPLFIIAGAIMHVVGRKEWPQLRGLLRTHPVLALTCLAGCYALAGLPFTLSFTAKEAFFYQIVHAAETRETGAWIIGAAGVLTAMCNVCIFVRFFTTFIAPAPAAAGARTAHSPHALADNPASHDAGHAVHAHEPERGFWGACIWWPAAVLVAFQFVGGIAPPLFEAIVRPVETHPLYFTHLPGVVHALTHPGVPLLMTGLAIVLGVGLHFLTALRRPDPDFYDALFPWTYRAVEQTGFGLARLLQTGSLRTYIVGVLLALAVGLGVAVAARPGLLESPDYASMAGADVGLALAATFLTALICATALLIPVISSRIVRVLILGACGFSVTGMYLVYQAPDLALTQLMFEIISVILFLLVLRLLPEETKRHRDATRLPRAVLASVVGLVVGWVVVQAGAEADQRHLEAIAQLDATETVVEPAAAGADASQTDPKTAHFEPTGLLGDWFLRHAYKGSAQTDGRGAGGSNVVNVILVDFRGYDTLGEITVLAIAMMGVMALLGAVGPAVVRAQGPNDPDAAPPVPQPHLRSVLLRTAMRLILPLSLILATYVFFKGHNEPGGGFIGGLIAAVGLAVYRMTEGSGALKRLIPFRPGKIAAIGLLLALATGATPLLLQALGVADNLPFLMSGQAYVPRYGADPFHLPSVLAFDLGVFIVVVGVAVGMINRFEEELE